jgi:antibiotic biosynthesis monooxygenase (ABM) superfamily enzyme
MPVMSLPESTDESGPPRGPVIVLSGATVRHGMAEQEAAVGEELAAIMTAMPGFISAKEYMAEDGEVLSVFRFESDDDLIRWRDHPSHLRYQASTDDYYESFWVQCALQYRAYEWRDGRKRPLPADPSRRASG